jgi:DNA repair protein RecN (Recombination protein N)
VLRELRVRNLAVIDSLTVPLGPGLNLLTGETGAGKSIVIDALELLLGERVQPADTIRTGAKRHHRGVFGSADPCARFFTSTGSPSRTTSSSSVASSRGAGGDGCS